MTRVVLVAVVLLAAIAAADAFRPAAKDEVVVAPVSRVAAQPAVQRSSADFVAVGPFTRKRVLERGREYLSSESVDSAFPSADLGEPFDIAHLATAPDGTLALAVYRFPAKEPAQAGIELWRKGRLVGAFRVPAGAFGGGLGFANGGRLVATVLADHYTVLLFNRSGERVASLVARS